MNIFKGTDKYFPGAVYFYHSTLRKEAYKTRYKKFHDFLTSRPVIVVGNSFKKCPSSGYSYVRVIPMTSSENSLKHGGYPVQIEDDIMSYAMPYLLTTVRVENLQASYGMLKVDDDDFENIMDAAEFFSGRCDIPAWLEETFEKYGEENVDTDDPFDDSYSTAFFDKHEGKVTSDKKKDKEVCSEVVAEPVGVAVITKKLKSISFADYVDEYYSPGKGAIRFSDIYADFQKHSIRPTTVKAASKVLGHLGYTTTKIQMSKTVMGIVKVKSDEETEVAPTSEVVQSNVGILPNTEIVPCPVNLNYGSKRPKMVTGIAIKEFKDCGFTGDHKDSVPLWIRTSSKLEKVWVLRARNSDVIKLMNITDVSPNTIRKIKVHIFIPLMPLLNEIKNELKLDPSSITTFDYEKLNVATLLSTEDLTRLELTSSSIKSIKNYLRLATGFNLFE